MKAALIAITSLLLIGAAAQSGSSGRQPRQMAVKAGTTDVQQHGRVPVLVELFTSEGCSSCPPADTLLAELEEKQPVPGAEIIGLEEHVDYWDHQGWVDPFSGSQWTARQEDYAAVHHEHGVYTPQMVVNGEADFVGSREREARQNIAAAASQAHVPIAIEAVGSNKPGELQFRISSGKLPNMAANDHAEVFLAITESGLHTQVRAGENSGVDMHHSAVLRTLRKIGNAEPEKEPSFGNDVTMKVDKAWKRPNLQVVVFVQEKRTRQILGVEAVPLEPLK